MRTLTDRDMLAWRLEVASGIVSHFGIADTDTFEVYEGFVRDLTRLPDRAVVDASPIAVSPLGALILAENAEGLGWVIPAGWTRKSTKYWSRYASVAAFAQYLVTAHNAETGPTHADTVNAWQQHPVIDEKAVVKVLMAAAGAIESGTFTPELLAAVTL